MGANSSGAKIDPASDIRLADKIRRLIAEGKSKSDTITICAIGHNRLSRVCKYFGIDFPNKSAPQWTEEEERTLIKEQHHKLEDIRKLFLPNRTYSALRDHVNRMISDGRLASRETMVWNCKPPPKVTLPPPEEKSFDLDGFMDMRPRILPDLRAVRLCQWIHNSQAPWQWCNERACKPGEAWCAEHRKKVFLQTIYKDVEVIDAAD